MQPAPRSIPNGRREGDRCCHGDPARQRNIAETRRTGLSGLALGRVRRGGDKLRDAADGHGWRWLRDWGTTNRLAGVNSDTVATHSDGYRQPIHITCIIHSNG